MLKTHLELHCLQCYVLFTLSGHTSVDETNFHLYLQFMLFTYQTSTVVACVLSIDEQCCLANSCYIFITVSDQLSRHFMATETSTKLFSMSTGHWNDFLLVSCMKNWNQRCCLEITLVEILNLFHHFIIQWLCVNSGETCETFQVLLRDRPQMCPVDKFVHFFHSSCKNWEWKSSQLNRVTGYHL